MRILGFSIPVFVLVIIALVVGKKYGAAIPLINRV